jgi:hypothetical protein
MKHILKNLKESHAAANVSKQTSNTEQMPSNHLTNTVPHQKGTKSVASPELIWVGHYLAGHIEANADIRESQLTVFFDVTDYEKAKTIVAFLGYGQTSDQPLENGKIPVIFSGQELTKLIGLINGKLVCESTIQKLVAYQYPKKCKISLAPPLKQISKESPWLAGFIDATASFRLYVRPRPFIKLYIHCKEESPLLTIAQHFSVPESSLGLISNGFVLCISTKKRIASLTAYLSRFHLQTRKNIQFLIFQDAAQLIETKMHLSEEGVSQMAAWKKELEDVYLKPVKQKSVKEKAVKEKKPVKEKAVKEKKPVKEKAVKNAVEEKSIKLKKTDGEEEKTK